MKRNYVVLLILTFTLLSCNYKLISTPYTLNQPLDNGEIIYYLPKSLLHEKITYIATVKTTYEDGVPTEDAPSYKVKSVEITPILINDYAKAFVTKGDNSKFFFLTDNTSVKFNQFGLIQSFQSDLEDKTLETVENTLKGAANIAKIVAIAGTSSSVFETNIKTKIQDANVKLALAIEQKNEKNIKEIKGQLLAYYELLKQYYENNKVVITEKELVFEFTTDPILNTPINLKPNAWLGFPTVVLNIKPLKGVAAPAVAAAAPIAPVAATTPTYSGLVYTIPEVMSVNATVVVNGGAQTLFDNVFALPQYGILGVLPVSSKLFTNKKTSIEFDPGTGTLASVHTESGSSSEKLSKTIASSADLLKTTISELKYDQKIENLKKEKEIKDLKNSLVDKSATLADSLRGNVDILKLQLEIEKLKKDIAEIKK